MRRAALPVTYLLAALVALGAGAFVADPLAAHRSGAEESLRRAGALRETLPGPFGTRLSVWEMGPLSAERPVVLFHGLGADATYFRRAAIALRRSGRTVLLPDAPGSGRSEAPREDAGYGLAPRVAALEKLLSGLGLEKVDLVGHSLGGWAAAAFALANPHRVGRLVLVDSGGFTSSGPDGPEAVRARFRPDDRGGAHALVAMLFLREGALRSGFMADALARGFRSEAVTRTVRSLSERDLLGERARALPEGTVFLWGERDAIFPLADARHAAAAVPGARLLVVTGVGHDPAIEAPRPFQDALERALR